jgi:hypothetical protein
VSFNPVQSVKNHGRVGALIGGGLGALSGARTKEIADFKKKEIRKPTTGERVHLGIAGGLGGAYLGHMAGRSVGAMRAVHKLRAPAPMPDWLKGVKTKAEAKKKYHDIARQHHPDMKNAGGDPEILMARSREYGDAQKHPDFPKVAMFNAFGDELFAIMRSKQG